MFPHFSVKSYQFWLGLFGVLWAKKSESSYLGEWAAATEMFHDYCCGGTSGKTQLSKEEIVAECFVLGLGF